jgi:limonene 1,2-monooxygenase
VAGVLSVTSLVQDASPLMGPTLLKLAREVEEQLYSDSTLHERELLHHFLTERRRGRNAVVAVSEDVVIASPTGPRAAAKNGINLLSVGATAKGGFDALALHWDVMEQRAPEFGHTPDRGKWRLCGPMHLAETKEQAIEDVRFGLDAWCDYTQDVLAAPHFRAAGKTFEERVAWVNETGLGVIGTPDEAVAQIERLEKQSGGFGSYLLIHHEWARPAATLRSYELFANNVKPRFQGSTSRLEQARDYARSRWTELDKRQGDAIAAAKERAAG